MKQLLKLRITEKYFRFHFSEMTSGKTELRTASYKNDDERWKLEADMCAKNVKW